MSDPSHAPSGVQVGAPGQGASPPLVVSTRSALQTV